MVKCTIKFDNNENGHYFAGETLSGTVNLIVNEAKKCKGFFLTIEGSAEVDWSEREPLLKTIYKGNERYFNYKSYILGSEDGESMTIEPCDRTFKFTYVLPSNLPYSVKKQHGYIRYKVKATLDIPWSLNIDAEKIFKICQNVDLNLYPNLKIPYESSHIAQCGLNSDKPSFFKVSIPHI
ncbi:unnamed protein product [Diamesa tonsa]